jgi:hypothetical protein
MNAEDQSLFDLADGTRRKEEGMSLAASHRSELLEVAQGIALELADWRGFVTSDDVAARLVRLGFSYEDLGNAAGSVFRLPSLEWSGRVVKSRRPSAHARMVKVWVPRTPKTQSPPAMK